MTTQKQQSINLDNNLNAIADLALSDRLKKDRIMIIEIQDKKIITALLQHVRDTKNTATNEYPTVTDTVEAILYYFLIGSSKKD